MVAQGVQAEQKRYYPEARDRVPGKELKERIIADPERWRQNVLAAMADQKDRNERNELPKWEKNKTLKKWWQNQYGEQNYFSIQDAIKENFVKFCKRIRLNCLFIKLISNKDVMVTKCNGIYSIRNQIIWTNSVP